MPCLHDPVAAPVNRQNLEPGCLLSPEPLSIVTGLAYPSDQITQDQN
jgi:hypothetical protein